MIGRLARQRPRERPDDGVWHSRVTTFERTILDGRALSVELFGLELAPDEYLRRFYPAAPVPPLGQIVGTAAPMRAKVNHGIWIALCGCGARGLPAPGCVVFMDQLWGWCVRCHNGATGRGWRPIAVPTPDERQMIEAVLILRARPEDRNWELDETVADLIAQNAEHGEPSVRGF